MVNRAFHLADSLDDLRMIAPIRDAIELLVKLIEGRGKRERFEEMYDAPHEDLEPIPVGQRIDM